MKKAYYLLLALPLLLMSMKCDDDGPETACIFRNESQDTVAVVVSEEYPDTLYPMNPQNIYRNILPGDYQGIVVDYDDWNYHKDYVLQLFVYDHSIPQFGTYLRDKHVELARYQLTKEKIKAMKGVVIYPPQNNKTTTRP